jgi:hypothetical protein
MAPKPLIVLDHVGHSFDDGRIVALRDVNLSFGEGNRSLLSGRAGVARRRLSS